MSRTKNSIRNVKYAIIGQVLALIINLISRIIFVKTLNSEYLGLNGLFSNLLSILSFAELGIGSAIVYSMYKPLAEKDNKKLKSLMSLYKKSYITIGIIVLLSGLLTIPFLEFFINDMPNIKYIKLIYFMFVFNSAISYFFSYKQSLIIADQNRYIVTLNHYVFFILQNVIQIVILVITKNYILFLGLQIIITILENTCISKKADKIYPFLKEKKVETLEQEEKKIIIKNVKAMMFHRLGSIAVTGTDNILISKFVSIISVGVYSNYLLIVNAINVIFGLGFESITASIGNIGVTETINKRKVIFECIDFIDYWLYGFASICLLNLLNPFIFLWVGKNYLFDTSIVILIVLNFYLTGRRRSVIIYRDALGLFWYDRYKPLFEAGINLICSIVLVKKIGIQGVFIGTIISTLTTCIFVEPYILYKYGFKSSAKPYFIKYVKSLFLLLIVGSITSLICNIFNNEDLLTFLFKLVICALVPNILFTILLCRTNEFKYLFNIVKSKCNLKINILRK